MELTQKKIETYLLNNIKPELEKYVADYELKQKITSKKTDPSKIKNKLQRLQELYINELIDLDDYRASYNQYKKELDEITSDTIPVKKDLSSIRSFLNLDIQNIYDSLTPQERRALWGSIIDKLIISNDEDIEIIFL